jgi:arabinofuranosyltransferase
VSASARVLVGRVALGAALLLLAVVLVRTAWLSDDAYITMRAVDHLVGGDGPVYNVGERVQAFTHPLWMLLLSLGYACTHDARLVAFLLSALCDVGVAWLLVRRFALAPASATLALVAWLFSKAAVDYSTSGLENPLSHLLVLAFLATEPSDDRERASTRRLFARLAVAALALVNRLDVAVVLAPSLVGAVVGHARAAQSATTAAVARRSFAGSLLRSSAVAAAASLPLVAWFAFSLVYYGFPFPNSAYAKLSTGIAASSLWRHGLDYLGQTVRFDPVTALAIAATVVGVVVTQLRARVLFTPSCQLAAGLLLHLVYVASVGGDFMRGRFLTVPFFASCAWIAARPLFARWSAALPAAALLVALGFLAGRPPVTSGPEYGGAGFDGDEGMVRGVADERGFYYAWSGLLRSPKFDEPAVAEQLHGPLEFRRPPDGGAGEVKVLSQLGFYGFASPRLRHVADLFALVDPLLARLPAMDPWDYRVGHYRRKFPDGYLETLQSGENRIADPRLRAYYDELRLVVRGPLFTQERWRAIARLNTRRPDEWFDPSRYVWKRRHKDGVPVQDGHMDGLPVHDESGAPSER